MSDEELEESGSESDDFELDNMTEAILPTTGVCIHTSRGRVYVNYEIRGRDG